MHNINNSYHHAVLDRLDLGPYIIIESISATPSKNRAMYGRGRKAVQGENEC